MNTTAIALQGLQQASAQFESAATSVASFGATSQDGSNVDTVDLSAEMVAMIAAKNQVSVNLGTLKVADQISKSTIDMMA